MKKVITAIVLATAMGTICGSVSAAQIERDETGAKLELVRRDLEKMSQFTKCVDDKCVRKVLKAREANGSIEYLVFSECTRLLLAPTEEERKDTVIDSQSIIGRSNRMYYHLNCRKVFEESRRRYGVAPRSGRVQELEDRVWELEQQLDHLNRR